MRHDSPDPAFKDIGLVIVPGLSYVILILNSLRFVRINLVEVKVREH